MESTQNVIKKVKHTFRGASYPYTLIKIIQINGQKNELWDMDLRDFCCLFVDDQKGARRNKICTHLNNNFFPFLFPKYSIKKDSVHYSDYCNYGLIWYRPWVGEFYIAWGGNDATDDNIIKTSEELIEHLLRNN